MDRPSIGIDVLAQAAARLARLETGVDESLVYQRVSRTLLNG
jgi:hypothetical protein